MKGFAFALLVVALLPLLDTSLRYGNGLEEANQATLSVVAFQRASADAEYSFSTSFRLAAIDALSDLSIQDTMEEAAVKVCRAMVEWAPDGTFVGRVNENDFFDSHGLRPLEECSCRSALRVQRKEGKLRLTVGSGKGCLPVGGNSFWHESSLAFGKVVSIIPYSTEYVI